MSFLKFDLHRSLNPKDDWSFFDSGYALAEQARSVIHPLTEAAARTFWELNVSANPIERHPQLLPEDHWLQPTTMGPSWLNVPKTSQLNPAVHSNVADFLNETFELGPFEEVFFVIMREHVYSVLFGIFTSHLEAFLALDDEAPFLFHRPTGRFACFGPNGQLSFGEQLSA